jgi:hypothetical protein
MGARDLPLERDTRNAGDRASRSRPSRVPYIAVAVLAFALATVALAWGIASAT